MRYLSLLLLLLGFVNCDSSKESVPEPSEWEQAKALWQRQAIQNYTITQQIVCYCIESYTRPRTLEVQNGQLFTVNGETYNPDHHPEAYSIDAFFELLEQNLGREPHQTTLVFDETYGYTTHAYFDFEEMIADEEIGFYFTGFQPE